MSIVYSGSANCVRDAGNTTLDGGAGWVPTAGTYEVTLNISEALDNGSLGYASTLGLGPHGGTSKIVSAGTRAPGGDGWVVTFLLTFATNGIYLDYSIDSDHSDADGVLSLPLGSHRITAGTALIAIGSQAAGPHHASTGLMTWSVDDGVTPVEPEPDPGIPSITILDPTGAVLAELDDAYDKNFQIDANGPGSGHFKLNRYSPNATEAILAGGNVVAVLIPRIDPDEPIFAFFLEDENVKLISTDEQGGEYWDISGQGVMSYPNRAVWQAKSFTLPWWVGATDPDPDDIGQIEVANGDYTSYTVTTVGYRSTITAKSSTHFTAFTAFYNKRKYIYFDSHYFPALRGQGKLLVQISSGPHITIWVDLASEGITDHYQSFAFDSTVLLTDISTDTPGAILYYLWTEALSADRPIHPTPSWDVDFTATLDSNGDPWLTTDALAGMTAELGEDYFTTIQKLIGTGVIDVEMGPDFVMHAYNAPSGVDRTSATFAADKVRFVKAVNVADELQRSLVQKPVATWAEVIGNDSALAQVTLDGSSGFIPRETSLKGESSDPLALAALGQAQLQREAFMSDGVRFNVTAVMDPDELVGEYLPGPDWTAHGKFWVRDMVTLHTGIGEFDLTNESVYISSITITEDDAGYLNVTVEVGAVFIFVGGAPGVAPRPVPTVVGIGTRPAPTTGTGTITTTRTSGDISSGGVFDGGGVSDHSDLTGLSDPGAHPATAISYSPGGTIAATNVQAAIAEAASEAIQNSLLTTQDDIIVRGATVPARLAKGSDGQVLTVDPTTHHLVWASPGTGAPDSADYLVGTANAGAPLR